MVGYFARIASITLVLMVIPGPSSLSGSIRAAASMMGSMWILDGSIPYSSAFFIILSKTRRRSAADLGIPVSSHSMAMTSQPGFSAIILKIESICFLLSMDTELKSPGFLQNLYVSARTSVLGLSMEIGTSVTLCTKSIIQCRVSTSPTSTEAHTSIKAAPSAASFRAISLIHSSSRPAIAFAIEGIVPFSFSAIIIIVISSCYPAPYFL